ncbi:MAG: hypothetical protein AAGF94_08710 [Pseudomonadota bacterium]
MIELLALVLVALAILVPVVRRRSAGQKMSVPRLFGGSGCRWKKDKFRRSEHFTRWICLECSVDAFTSDGRPPKECKRYARSGQL